MRNSHFNDEFLVLLGPIISRLFTCSNAGKNKIKKQRVLALVLSLWFYHRATKNGRQIIVQSLVNTNPESAEMVAVDLISSSTFSKKMV